MAGGGGAIWRGRLVGKLRRERGKKSCEERGVRVNTGKFNDSAVGDSLLEKGALCAFSGAVEAFDYD